MRRSSLLGGVIMLGAVAVVAPAYAAAPIADAVAKPIPDRVLVAALYADAIPYSDRNVQVLLNELGYNVGAPDGLIGPKSRAAIRSFQIDARLPTSGEPSLALFRTLQEAVASQQGSQAVPAPAPQAIVPSTDLVGGIQGELRQRGYVVPSLNGRLDGPTAAAIRAYQSSAGLTMTGQPSEELLSSLQSAPRSAAAVMQSRHDQVVALQRALNARGYDAGPEDGAIGPKVRSAIRMYQTKSRMPVTGEVTPELMAGLGINANGSTTQTVAQTTDAGGNGTGLRGAQVMQLEQSLTALGYKVGQSMVSTIARPARPS